MRKWRHEIPDYISHQTQWANEDGEDPHEEGELPVLVVLHCASQALHVGHAAVIVNWNYQVRHLLKHYFI